MSSHSVRPVIGVLALQGDVREHLAAIREQGAEAVTVRRPEELAAVDRLVLPGGESTTMVKLAARFGLLEPPRAAIREGLPAYGSCAGMILLADRLLDAPPDQETIGGLDVTVRRNAFGRQVDSFESDLIEGDRRGPAARRLHPGPVGRGRLVRRSRCSAASWAARPTVRSSPSARETWWPPASTPN